MSLMPLIRSLAFKCLTYYSKLIAVILSLSEIMPTYSHCTEKGLVCIIIITLFSCQPSSYTKYTKLNMRSFCNVCLVFNTECIFFAHYYIL